MFACRVDDDQERYTGLRADGAVCTQGCAPAACEPDDTEVRACAAACYLALATSGASSPLLATHNGWLVATDSGDAFQLVCTESLTTCVLD